MSQGGRSQTYETRMNAAVQSGDWAGARRVWEDQFQSRWRQDPKSGVWEARDGGGQKLSADQVEQHRSKLESWLQSKIATRSSTGSASKDEEEPEEKPLERRRVAPRSASAFQDTASVLSARAPASVRNAFVPSSIAAQGSALAAAKPPSSATFVESLVQTQAKSAVVEVAQKDPEPEPQEKVESLRPPESVRVDVPKEESDSNEPELQERHEDPASTFGTTGLKGGGPCKSGEDEDVQPQREEAVVASSPAATENKVGTSPSESLNVATESAFVGRRIVSAFDPKALPSASEIDALQALQYPVYKVSAAEWNRLAASGPMVLIDPCMRPATTFLLMKHSKSGSLVRVYPDGKPATGVMDWREICVVFEEIYPHVSVDLDALVKAVRSRSSVAKKRL